MLHCCSILEHHRAARVPHPRPDSWPAPCSSGAHATPGPFGSRCPAASWSWHCGWSGAWGSACSLLSFCSTPGYILPSLGGELKSVKLYLQLVSGGELQIWPLGPEMGLGESCPICCMHHRIPEPSQNPRIIAEPQSGGTWRGLLEIIQSNPLPEQVHQEQVAQDGVQVVLESLQRRLHRGCAEAAVREGCSGHPVSHNTGSRDTVQAPSCSFNSVLGALGNFPNAVSQLNPKKWCSLGSQIKGPVNTERHEKKKKRKNKEVKEGHALVIKPPAVFPVTCGTARTAFQSENGKHHNETVHADFFAMYPQGSWGRTD